MGRRRMHVGYWWESQKERDNEGNKGIGGLIVLRWIRERYGSRDWIHLAHDKENLRAPVNAVMDLLFPHNAGKLSTTQLVVSQEGLGSMEIVCFYKGFYMCYISRPSRVI
jgi:hypothetical protein